MEIKFSENNIVNQEIETTVKTFLREINTAENANVKKSVCYSSNGSVANKLSGQVPTTSRSATCPAAAISGERNA